MIAAHTSDQRLVTIRLETERGLPGEEMSWRLNYRAVRVISKRVDELIAKFDGDRNSTVWRDLVSRNGTRSSLAGISLIFAVRTWYLVAATRGGHALYLPELLSL